MSIRRRISTASSRLFNPGAKRLPFIVTEVGMSRTGREDQVIVGNFRVAGFDLSSFATSTDCHFSEHHLDVWKFAEDAADGSCDVGRRKRRGRDLIQERLKQVVICPIDHGHTHRFSTKHLGCFETAETGANNHDMRK